LSVLYILNALNTDICQSTFLEKFGSPLVEMESAACIH